MKALITSPATLRVMLLLAAPILGAMPGVSIDPVTDFITIDPHTVWPWMVGAMGGAFGVYAVWGKK